MNSAESDRLEAELRFRQEEIEKLLDLIPAAVWTASDPECRVVKGNATANELWESTPGENLSASLQPTVRRHFTPDGVELSPSQLPLQMAAATNAVIRDVEIVVEMPSGVRRTFLGSASPLRTNEGQVRGAIAAFVDVTGRKQIERALQSHQQELQASEQRFRAFVNASSDVVYRMSADWSVMREFHGRSVSDSAQPNTNWIRDHIHPDDQPMVTTAIHDAIASKSMFELEHRVMRADGTLGWTLSRAVPLFDPDGNITEWFGAARDITSRKQAEEALIQSEKLLSVGRLAATVSHEINNPLEAAMSLLFLASSPYTPDEQVRAYVVAAEGELKRAAEMARRTLSFYRPANRPKRYRVAEVLHDALRLLSPMLSNRKIEVRTRLDEAAAVFGDADEIRQVCTNLIANAVDAGATTLDVRLTMQPWRSNNAERAVRITIADTGCGIPRHLHKQIFQPFVTTKAATGTGLGLWACKEIVQKAGGSIRFRSSAGRGSVFCVFLAVADSHSTKPTSHAAA